MEFLRLFCIRHGQTVTNQGYVFNGWTDVELSEEGKRQLNEAVAALKGLTFDAIYSSDLIRAVYGGKALAAQAGLNLIEEKQFRELHFGDCEGLPFAKIQELYPALAEELIAPEGKDFKFPNGETAGFFRQRVGEALKALRERHPSGMVALFSHAGVGRAILAALLGLSDPQMWSFEQDHGCLNLLDIYPNGAVRVRVVNGYLGPNGYHQKGPGFERLGVPVNL
ncbi:MAG: histidine phosphatase family protein [Deltaproteobacteria bacterium]|jgi:broad specificity phosphatase PhoE|nr:histidine phosphatase family protein [Deltaproteobacteria bacterium]